MKEETWTCNRCGALNDNYAASCDQCQAERIEMIKKIPLNIQRQSFSEIEEEMKESALSLN